MRPFPGARASRPPETAAVCGHAGRDARAPRRLLFLSALLLALVGQPASAQQLLLDRGVRAAGLWCFPRADKPTEYLYIPSRGRLGQDEKGGPEFSFLRYVENTKTGDGAATITAASGGGIVHFLAFYETPAKQIEDAQTELRELAQSDEVRLAGPVLFQSGRYTVVSSLVKGKEGEEGRAAVISGNAPVLEGGKIAVSAALDRQGAQLLYNSFRTATPDVTVLFEMQFGGVTDAYDATLEVDWSEVHKERRVAGGAKTPWVGVDVEHWVKDLVRNGTVKLESRGANAMSEALLNSVYSKLVDLLFQKTEQPPPAMTSGGGVLDAIGQLLGSGGKISPWSLSGSYRLRDLKTGGRTVMRFNHQAAAARTAMITFNIGDLYRRYGKNPDYFAVRNTFDPAFTQREIVVSVDGSVLQDFEKYVNSATVTIRKEHGNGQVTLREFAVNRDSFAKNPQGFRAVYGWNGDTDRTAWLDYSYRVGWSFKDGGSYEEPWRKTSDAGINLLPPYERREILLSGDGAALGKAGVRAAVVTLQYDFFGRPKTMRPVVIRPKDEPIEERIEVIQPRGDYRYTYQIRWQLAGGKEVVKPPAPDTAGLILIDELPGGNG